MYMGEFIKVLATELRDQGCEMPFHDERPWHLLLYNLKKKGSQPKAMDFIGRMRFDWDGPYPKCQALSDYLQALHWNASVSVANPTFETIAIPEEMANLWKRRAECLDQESLDFLSKAVEMAKEEFRSAISFAA